MLKAVIPSTAQTTKMYIVYNALAKEKNNAPSTNDCLHAGSVLQPIQQAILTQNCLKPIALRGDIKQACQIEITEENYYALHLHWVKDIGKMKLSNLLFARLALSNPFRSKRYFSLTS